MSDYVIVTDSSADLPDSLVKELGVEVLPLSFTVQGKTYHNYPDDREMDPKVFYKMLRDGEMATTSAVNVAEYTAMLEPLLQAGKDILVLAFSSGLSTTYQSSVIAVNELAEQYPDRKIYTVDTLCASMGQGLLVWHAVQEQKRGQSIEAVRDWVEENKLRLCHWFTVDDLMYLKRGGRISAATALVGTMLQIKPLLHVDDEGHLINMTKTRGRKAAIDAMVKKAQELGAGYDNSTMFISHGDCLSDAEYLSRQLKEKCGVKDVVISYVGAVIGSHSGPGTLALFFLGSHR